MAAWTQFWAGIEFGRSGWSMSTWIGGFAALLLLAGWLYRRDSVELHWGWRAWLTALRGLALLVLLVVALQPQQRESRTAELDSRVVFLLDTSVSMGIRDELADKKGTAPPRAEQVAQFLKQSPLLETLRQTHNVALYTFDSRPQQQQELAKKVTSVIPGATDKKSASPPDFTELLKPRGLETRIGESVLEVIRREHGETLAGMVLFTDGVNNAGIDAALVVDAARAEKVKLFPLGVGSTAPPINIQLVDVQAPTHVHVGDGFTLSAYISGQGMTQRPLVVELLTKKEGEEGEMTVLQEKETQLLADGVPVTVEFEYIPTEAVKRLFRIRVKPKQPVNELITEDNEDSVKVEVVEDPTRVLVIAGGPMRDFQFVKNLLYRDKSVKLDVWLQTAVPGYSQESEEVTYLFGFPQRDELFKYDAVLAFDPNWDLVAGETKRGEKGEIENGTTLLAEWVYTHAGGLMLISGDVYTPELASVAPENRERLQKLFDLYPVLLDTSFSDDEDQAQPWPVEFTRDGLEAGFLQLSDNPASSATSWQDFPGIFKCYPAKTAKSGATVFARFADPRASAPPILLASQYYGSGRVLYLGSPELWRLRSVEEDYYDRLWIRMLREIGQGRLLRGTNRALLLLDRKSYPIGSTVQVRARVLDTQLKPYAAAKLPLEVVLPGGRPQTPRVELVADPLKPGDFTAQFVAGVSGLYNLKLAVPDSVDVVPGAFSVKLPNLEFDRPEQNESLLKLLARGSGGKYVTMENAAEVLPKELTNHSRQTTVFEMPRPLWDRAWVIYFLVAVLGVEWLTRKLLRLA